MVGKTQRPAGSRASAPPRPPPAGMLRRPPARPRRELPGPALTAQPGVSSHPGEGRGESFGGQRGRELPERRAERRGSAQPGDCIAPLPAAAAAAVIFQAHRGSPWRARLLAALLPLSRPPGLPSRPASARRRLHRAGGGSGSPHACPAGPSVPNYSPACFFFIIFYF